MSYMYRRSTFLIFSGSKRLLLMPTACRNIWRFSSLGPRGGRPAGGGHDVSLSALGRPGTLVSFLDLLRLTDVPAGVPLLLAPSATRSGERSPVPSSSPANRTQPCSSHPGQTWSAICHRAWCLSVSSQAPPEPSPESPKLFGSDPQIPRKYAACLS